MQQPPPPQSAAVHTPNQGGNLTLVLVALGLGLITIVATNWHISNIRERVDAQMVTVYMTNKPMDAGKVLKRRDLREFEMPEKYAENMPFKPVYGKEADVHFDKKEILRPVESNKIVTHDLYTREGASGDEPTPGMEVATIAVKSENIPPFLKAGDSINLWANFAEEGQLPDTKLVLEVVKVFGVGANIDPQGFRSTGSFRNISLEVTHDSAKALYTIETYLQRKGFQITLRARGDKSRKLVTDGVNPEVLRIIGMKPATAS